MGKGFIALLCGIGVAGWVYAKTSRSSGGNEQSSMIAGGAAGVVAFIVMLLILSFIPGI